MVDLFGEGLPGILYSDDRTTLYCVRKRRQPTKLLNGTFAVSRMGTFDMMSGL
jgi:hypothetical protein